MSTVRAPGALTRLARQHGLVRSSLRRTTDRIDAAVTAVLAILALLVVPLATTIAMASYHHERAETATTASQRTAVTAVLLTDPPPNLGCMIVNAAAIGFDLMLGGWMLLGALWWAVCRVLGRINAAWWDVQWARTEPGWSHRPRQ
ncbi:MAG: hypothetical protein JO272_12410 [Pseudonocardiales bacterium]|nr:hypothetical protein [Pseudonocardiales bacterium]